MVGSARKLRDGSDSGKVDVPAANLEKGNKEVLDKAEPPSGLARSQQELCLRFAASES